MSELARPGDFCPNSECDDYGNSTVVFLRFWDTCDTIVTISCCQVKV